MQGKLENEIFNISNLTFASIEETINSLVTATR